MSSDSDPVVGEVLRRARAEAAPAASELEGVLARVRSQIAAAPVVLHEVPEPEAPLAPGAGANLRAPGRAALHWAAGLRSAGQWPTLRRWSGTVLSVGMGFALGVQYADHRSPPETPVVSPNADAPLALAPAPAATPSEPVPLLAPQPEATFVPALPGRTSAPLDRALSTRRVQRRAPARPARDASRAPTTSAVRQETLSFAQVVERLEQAQRGRQLPADDFFSRSRMHREQDWYTLGDAAREAQQIGQPGIIVDVRRPMQGQ